MPTDLPTTIDVHADAVSPRLVKLTAETHLIFGGVLERHPGLKIVAAHGGGHLPSYFARTEHGFEVRPEAQTSPHRPGYYPFDMGEKHPLDVLQGVEGLSESDRERIKRGNALDLVGLAP